MPYIIDDQRPYWDQFINPFLDELLKPGATPPSQGGLNYALSRIVWAIFNHFPSYQVGSALRAVLIDVHDEFTRRKFNPYEDTKIVENGDLPEGSLASVFPDKAEAEQCEVTTKTGTTETCSGETCNCPPESDNIKVLKLSQLFEAIQSGKTIDEIFKAAETIKQPVAPKQQQQQQQPVSPNVAVNPGGKPYLLSDPAIEADTEESLLLALKAFAIAQMSGASDAKLTELSSKIGTSTKTLLKVYKGEKL